MNLLHNEFTVFNYLLSNIYKTSLINNTPVQNTKLKSYVIIKKKLTINKYHKIRQVQTQGLYICIGGFMKKFRKPCSIVKDPGE